MVKAKMAMVKTMRGGKGKKGSASSSVGDRVLSLRDRDAQGAVGRLKGLEGGEVFGGRTGEDIDLPGQGRNEDHVAIVEEDPHGPSSGVPGRACGRGSGTRRQR